MVIEKTIQLKPGRERSVLNRHPWIFSGAIAKTTGDPLCGENVLVSASSGELLGIAAYSPDSNIRARMWTWDSKQVINESFFEGLIKNALSLRTSLIKETETDAIRLIYAESDGIPGLVVDRYADTLILQSLSCGIEYWKDLIVEKIVKATNISNVYERSDVTVRRIEGLPLQKGVLKGKEPSGNLTITENELKYEIDPINGQKTGFFIDQRQNRLLLRKYARNRKVLDCFCYSGGFSINALAGGADSVLAIDSSNDALQSGQRNVLLNNLDDDRIEWRAADVFERMRKLRDKNEKFDLIMLDPPKFAPTHKQVQKASRAYKDINLLAFKLLNPGGILFTFSCSGGVSEDLFQKIIFGAALDAGVDAKIVEKMHQGPDHPTALNFPEGNYLKGLVCMVS